jgi:flagellar motor switch protein FliG
MAATDSSRPLFPGSGRKRAAALLVALGPELGADILSRMSDEDISQLTWETLGIGQLTPMQREDVLRDLYRDMHGGNVASVGGVRYALDMLELTIGTERAQQMLTGMGAGSGAKPFTYLAQLDERDALAAIQNEPPQALAVIFANLSPDIASRLLSGLPDEIQANVIVRIAQLDRAAPDVVEALDALLRDRIGSALGDRMDHHDVGGIDSLVEILRQLDPATERGITGRIDAASGEIGEEIRRRMFVFDDIVLLDGRSVQRVLRDIDSNDLAYALKGTSEDVAQHILDNMSERAGAMVKDDMQALGPIRVRLVEDARNRIVSVIRQLEQNEEIFIQRGNDELVA